jgi:hypothetical protein
MSPELIAVHLEYRAAKAQWEATPAKCERPANLSAEEEIKLDLEYEVALNRMMKAERAYKEALKAAAVAA